MKSLPHTRLPEVKRPAARWLLLFLLGAVLLGVSGCATNEPENDSVRPWNTPQGWEGGLPMLNQQHQ
jgi:hypothetical protein